MVTISIPSWYLNSHYVYAHLISSDNEPVVNRRRAFKVTYHNDCGIKFEQEIMLEWNETSAGIRIPIPGFLLKGDFCNSGYLYYYIARDGKRGFIFKEKKYIEEERNMNKSIVEPEITNIIFNDPATIVFWNDGTKTVVKTMDGDKFDPYVGVAIAIAKKRFGSNSTFKKLVHRYMKEEEE